MLPPPSHLPTDTCIALPQDLRGSCDATLGDDATVQFAPLDFSIVDPDGATNTVLTYNISSGNEGGYFSIDATTGIISLERRLDRDRGTSSFFLIVLVSDGIFSATFNVTISVEDINDNAPEPTSTVFSGRVSEELPRFTPVLNVTFTDIDEGVNGNIVYSLDPSQSDFNIDPQTGMVTTNRVFDFEAGDESFFFAVFAQDGGLPPGFGSANVSIVISDQNDNRPVVNASLIPGAEYIEQGPPILFANVIVSDADSDSFPLLYSLVRITNRQDVEEEVTIPILPPNFKSVFVDNTLVVVGTATADVVSDLLSAVTYSNLADEPGLPLQRVIEFGVCDELTDDAFLPLVMNISEVDLTEEDATQLLQTCLGLVSSTVTLPLLETNDRPTLRNVSVEFQPVPEDLPEELNKGEFIRAVFSDVVQDSDRGGFIGIAVVGHGSPAEAFFGALADTDPCVRQYLRLEDTCGALRDIDRCQCRQEGDSLSTCGIAADDSYTFFFCDHIDGRSGCLCIHPESGRKKRQLEGLLPPLDEISSALLDTRVGSPIDVTSVFINNTAFSLDIVDEETLQQFINLASGNASYIFTTVSQDEVVIPLPRANITYEAFGNVSETSAVVLGPTSLIRFIPFPDETGTAEIFFKAWDGTNGVAIGSRGVDTTVPTDSSFSLETGLATAEIIAVNDAPQIQLGGPGLRDFETLYVESRPSVVVASNTSVIVDPDNDLLLRDLRVNITKEDGSCDLPAVSNDVLQYMNETLFPMDSVDITTIGEACVSYSFNGQFSVNQWQSFLRMIRFAVADDEPSDHRRRLSFVISDAQLDSDPSYTFIDVQLVSDNCPVISITTASPLIYIEHSGSVLLDGGVTVVDIDRDAAIQSAEVAILETCSQCTLIATSILPGITQDFSNITRTLRLTGPATPADFQQVLRSVQFEDAGDEPSFSLVRVRFTLIDPTETLCPEAIGEINIVIERINDNTPVLYLDYPNTRNVTTQLTEGTARVPLTGSVLIVDPDEQESATYDIAVQISLGCVPSEDILEFMDPQPTSLTQSYTSIDCSLSLQGDRSTIAGELPRIRYRNTGLDAPTAGDRVITFTITEDPLPSTASFAILTVVAVNDAPFVDLDVSDPLSSDSMLEFVLGTGSVLITGPSGGSITDPDDTSLEGMVAVLREIDSAGNMVSPTSDQFFEELRTVISSGLDSNYLAGELRITGTASVADYTAVLNQIAYVNSRIPPTENRREITVTVSDGELDSGAVVARIIFTGELNPPLVNLNGNLPGTSTEVEFIITQPPVAVFPDVSVSDPDRDSICEVNITMTGPRGTCDPNSISFDTAFGDIGVSTFDLGDEILYQVTTSFFDCRDAIVFQSVLSGVTFSASADTAVPTSCFLSVVVMDARRSISNEAIATIIVRQFNAPPFIDLDLGISGRDYSTVYFQGGNVRNIVSILDEALVQNITVMTVVGEAAGGEAGIDDGTTAHGVVIEEQSNAGYVLMDVDSPELAYLQVEFVLSSTLQYDVIRYPCIPATPTTLDPRGCISNGESNTVSNLVCDNSLFEACSAPVDLCSNLTVTIFCPETGRKAYRFQYLADPSTERYEALLGYLGYEYLLIMGGNLNQIRILNVTAFDGESVNPSAITRIRIQNQDVLVFITDPPPPEITFFVYEDERPNRPLVLYTVQVQRPDDTVPAPGEVEFRIVSGNIGNVFRINNLGEIFLIDYLDRETIARYDLTISAHIIGADIDTTTTGLIIVGVTDVNDNHPQTAPSYTVDVFEGCPGSEVARIIATDADEGTNAELNYLLLGIGVENFMIDSEGVVTTTVALNRTTEDFYFIVVIITDRGEIFLSGHTVININVVTPEPSLMIQTLEPFDVFEGTNVNTMIGQVQADEVGGFEGTVCSADIQYRIIGISPSPIGTPFPFRIDSQSGEFFVNAVLDSETTTVYVMVVEAFSTRPLFTPNPDTASITVNILDVNEDTPMFADAPYQRAVAENTATGTTVLTLVAVDDDSMNQGLIYSLFSDPSGLPFSVQPNGDVIVSGEIDFETDRMFSFTVQARDTPPHNMPSLSATAEVSFTILDRNDNPPVFVGVPYIADVRETVLDGYEVLSFDTTDADSEVNRAISYAISNLAGTPFSLVGRTIQVGDSALLTAIERAEVFVLEIVATNQGEDGSPLVSRETANISVILINEFPPAVVQDTINHPGYFEEHCGLGVGNSCDGIEVYDFGADTSDEDGGVSGQLNFALVTSGVPFTIDNRTGVLSISGRIDREVQNLYILQISISDSPDVDGTVFSTVVFINIPIYDIDDNAPLFVPPFEFAVTEEMTPSSVPFGRINISDPDINGTTTYFIIVFRDPPVGDGCIIDVPPDDEEYLPIQIDTNTGELTFCVHVDFETGNTQYQFDVRVVDNGFLDVGVPMTYSDVQRYTVGVVDSNDHPPELGLAEYFFTLSENSPENATVGEITATDEDSGTLNGLLRYSISLDGSSDCSAGLPFQIDREDGTLQTCMSLDYEFRQSYTFTVQVCDGAVVPLCDTAPVTVNVTDRNDNPPEFVPPVYTAEISETDSSLAMVFVVQLVATDRDSPVNSEVTFEIVTAGSPFALRNPTATTVEVFAAQPALIDFETGPRVHVIAVRATNEPANPSDDTFTAFTNVTVTITDVNDNSPVILPPLAFEIQENEPDVSVVGCIDATDADMEENSELEFFLSSPPVFPTICEPDLPFRVGLTTGCISTCQSLDFEDRSSYTFSVTVCDRGEPVLCSNASITVSVTDLNDNAPVFDQDPYIVDVNENLPAGEAVLVISSTDEDSPPNSVVFYDFVGASSPFDIRLNSEVYYTGAEELDFEGPSRTYILNLRAFNPSADPGGLNNTVETTVTINVVDRNDQPPAFNPAADAETINEHSPIGTAVYSLSTTDADTENNSAVEYIILQPISSPFSILGNLVVVSDEEATDFDPPTSIRSYILTIQAVNPPSADDDVTQRSNFTLTVNLRDINDNAPECLGPVAIMLPENTEVRVEFRRVLSDDIDSGLNGRDGLQFFVGDIMGSGSGAGDPLCSFEEPFRIDPDSGYLSICTAFDFERTNNYAINVTVCDSGSPQLCSVCPVAVNIMDVNDNAPVILPPTAFAVEETVPFEFEIACINATDADTGQNAVLNFSIVEDSCTISTPFQIVNRDEVGCIQVCRDLDFEQRSEYVFEVNVTDNGSPVLWNSTLVIIAIINVNDHAPEIVSPDTAEVIEEQADADVVMVIANDIDSPPFNEFTFSLLSDADGRFRINSTTGLVQTTMALDREIQPSYTILIQVSDDGMLSSTQNLTISLIDINDNTPEYLGAANYSFLEEMLFEQVLVFSDPDVGNNSALTYQVSDSRFTIDALGILRNVDPLDRDPATGGSASIPITVTVQDGGVPSREAVAMIVIILVDINDNPPIAQPPFDAEILDGARVGEVVLDAMATDADEGDNARLIFKIGDNSNGFRINSTTGVIELNEDIFLSAATFDTIVLQVNICDSGIPRNVVPVTYTFFVVSAVPLFPLDTYSFRIAENDFEGEVGLLRAQDRDNNPFNDLYEYTILFVSPYDTGFSIRNFGENGTLLAPSEYFDFEDAIQFELTVGVGRVNMTGIIDDVATVVVSLIDQNDNPPVLSPLNLTDIMLPESATNGDIVATAVAIDFDTGLTGQITYNHSGDGAEVFEFDSDGNFRVVDQELVDFESNTNFTFSYQACDGGTPQLCSEVGFISITIVNIDDLPPVFAPTIYTEAISEDFGPNRVILHVNFTDPDTPPEDVRLILSPAQTQFQISQISGALMSTDVPLDRETQGMHAFSVIANDTAGQTGMASVFIQLLDVNDVRPRVEPVQSTVTFLENDGRAFIADQLTVVDEDDISQYPLTTITVSLHSFPSASEPYPLAGGVCDHANYSILYDSNPYNLCGVSGCDYLLSPDQITIQAAARLDDGILESPGVGFTRNSRIFQGMVFEENFTVSIWVRLASPSVSGAIFEVTGGTNLLGVSVSNTGALSLSTSPPLQNPLTTVSLPTHDGEWHQVSLVHEGNSFILYFDCTEVGRAENADLDTASFGAGSFILGNRLSGFLSEMYFCLAATNQSNICCTVNCGESFEISAPTPNVTAVVNQRTRRVEFEYTGNEPSQSLSALQEAIETVIYVNRIEEPHPLDRGVLILVSDAIGPSDEPGVVILSPILINDQRPILDLNGLATAGIDLETTFNERSPTETDGTLIITEETALYDRDSGFFTINRIEINLLDPNPPNEFLFHTIIPPGFNIQVFDSGSRVLIQSSNPAEERFPDQFLDAVRLVMYRDVQEEPEEVVRRITFTVYDTGAEHINEPLAETRVTLVQTNDQPVLDLDTTSASLDTSVSFDESEGRVKLVSGTAQSITDPDSTMATEARFMFTQRPDGDVETLEVDVASLPNGITVTQNFDSSTGVLTVVGTYDFDTWLEILRTVEYVNTERNPDELRSRMVAVEIQDANGGISEQAFVFISITLFNNPPELFLGGPGVMNFVTTFVEDGPCIPLTSPDMEIIEVDSPRGIQLVRIRLSSTNADFDAERLQVPDPQPSNTFSIDSSFIIFALEDSSTLNYQQQLPRVEYCNTADEPVPLDRTVTFQATDLGLVTASGTPLTGATSAPATTTVQIMLVNDQPVLDIEPVNNVSIRGEPTPIINPDSISLDDSDDDLFDRLLIFITNPQDGIENEIIEFARQLPEGTFSIGPFSVPESEEIFYNVSFRGEGADRARVFETIAAIRYNNRAPDITVDPPRIICLQISDFKIFSERVCVDVEISPPNDGVPVFNTDSLVQTLEESNSLLIIANLSATDADAGLAGEITYSISRVESTPIGDTAVVTTFDGLFDIDTETGRLFAPNGLDADQYFTHTVHVTASDSGNPVRSAVATVQIQLTDINDIAPSFVGEPYVAPEQAEGLAPQSVFQVEAVDNDATTPNNIIARYGLVNGGDQFEINSANGEISYIALLDAELQIEYFLNVSAEDSGSPPQTSYTTVLFRLIDRNDNAAVVDQLATAIYVVEDEPRLSSIGPAIRITDADIFSSAIIGMTVTLTRNTNDQFRSYDRCLAECQDMRLSDAGLLSNAIDLLERATFTTDNVDAIGGFNEITIGDGNCFAIQLNRAAEMRDDGYGRITRSLLPPDFGSGDFSVSFVATIRNEGYIFLVPDQTDPLLPPAEVEREFALWVRRRDIRFYYIYGPARTRATAVYRLTDTDPFLTEIFDDSLDPSERGETRHFVLVVRSNPAEIDIYVNCTLLTRNGPISLSGPVLSPNPSVDVFIGQSRPHPVTSGRLGADVHGLYYHDAALSSSQILDFCSCGFEEIRLPATLPDSLPSSTIPITQTPDTITVGSFISSITIPLEDVVSVLRGIIYINTYGPPTFEPDRQLTFTLREAGLATTTTSGLIRLVEQDDALPEIDLNGLALTGIDFNTGFTEDMGPVPIVAPDVRIDRDVGGFVTPTFDRVVVELLNAFDSDEILTAENGTFILVAIDPNGQRVDVIGPGIRADFEPVLQTLTYNNNNDRPTTDSQRRISFTVTDTEGRTNTPIAFTTIDLTAVNDAPEFSLSENFGDLMGSRVYREDSTVGTVLTPNAELRDVDSDTLAMATIALTSPNLPTDTLTFDSELSPGISGSYNQMTGVLTLSGVALLDEYRSILRSVSFNSTDSPSLDSLGRPVSDPTRTVSIQVSDGDLVSQTAQIQIEFEPVNTPPVIRLISSTRVFEDGDPPLLIAPDAFITDGDNVNLDSLRLTLSTDVDNDVLSNGVQTAPFLVFGPDLLANLIDILNSIVYINNATEPTLIDRTVQIEACDISVDDCAEAVITIEVRDRNDNSPMFGQAMYNFSVLENSPVPLAIGRLNLTDTDTNVPDFTFRLSASGFPFVVQQVGNAQEIAGRSGFVADAELVTTAILNFETVSAYTFEVEANDGLNTGLTTVFVAIENENEAPVIDFESVAVVGSLASETALIVGEIIVTDPDIDEDAVGAIVMVRDIPEGSDESLAFNPPIDGYLFEETPPDSSVYLLTNNGSNVSIADALRNIQYVAGNSIENPSALRFVNFSVFDEGGLFSNSEQVNVSLASVPLFEESPYNVSLSEGQLHQDFLQVRATVESGGTVTAYGIESGFGVTIDPGTGFLSLVELLDRETEPVIEFQVFAVDSQPPARTGTTTVIINVLDENDVQPEIGGLGSITIRTAIPINPFPNITVTDPDISSDIELARITVIGDTDLIDSPFTGRVCVDEYNIISKMQQVCGLESFIDLLASSVAGGNASLTEDEFRNRIFSSLPSQLGYGEVTANFTGLVGNISEFFLSFVIRIEGSGYIAYYGSPDATERYISVYYDWSRNKLIVTLKRTGIGGLEGQIRVAFDLPVAINDDGYHFIVIEYAARDIVCVVDGRRVESSAVVYKERPFIGEVFGKLFTQQ